MLTVTSHVAVKLREVVGGYVSSLSRLMLQLS